MTHESCMDQDHITIDKLKAESLDNNAILFLVNKLVIFPLNKNLYQSCVDFIGYNKQQTINHTSSLPKHIIKI
jgi:hypothetical protein